MIIKCLDWENKTIKEIDTKIVRYLEDGLHYEKVDSNIILDLVIPYNSLLGVEGL